MQQKRRKMLALLQLFSMALTISTIVHCMEPEGPSTLKLSTGNMVFTVQLQPFTPPLQQQITNFYTTAATLIPKINRNDEESIGNLISLLGNIEAFKKQNPNIDSITLGSSAYVQQEPTFTERAMEKVLARANSQKTSFFFKLVDQYQDEILAHNKKTPSLQEWKIYFANADLPTKKALALATVLGIRIEESQIKRNTLPFQAIDEHAGVDELSQLIENIIKVNQCDSNRISKHLADLIYLNLHAPRETTRTTPQ